MYCRERHYTRCVDIAELTRNAVAVLPEGELERKLKLGRPLRVKLGIDVTAPDVTLGNGVPLRRMRAFQDQGHIGVLIVGDYTTRIGDPSGRKTERPIIDPAVIDANAQRYFEAASTIIDPDRTELRFNSEWLSKLDFAETLRLTRTTTVARILEREDFRKRYAANEPISISELLYPMMQAYDSVSVEADVELGGTDQTYNLLMGRDVMEAYGLEPQVALTVAYLDSWDGTGMSASRGNYIGLSEPAEEQFGKTMRIPDSLLPQWYSLVMERGDVPGDPMEAKLELARFIVRRSHGDDAVQRAEDHFTRVVREGEAPDEIQEIAHPDETVHLPQFLANVFGQSSSHWRRVIDQGGVKVDGEAVSGYDLRREDIEGAVIRAGKRQFVRIRPA
jgi:tyrosyl-tRNA synthetase